MADLNSFMRENGYRYPKSELKRRGTIRRIIDDYDVTLKVVITQKIAGIQVDKKSKHYHLGHLYTFVTTTKTDKYNVIRLVKAVTEAEKTFDIADEPLGGDKERLGG